MANEHTISRLSFTMQPASYLDNSLKIRRDEDGPQDHPAYLNQLASTILYNLQYQHDWTQLKLVSNSPRTSLPLPRPLVAGLPPKRLYVHPDEQAEILKTEHASGQSIEQTPELEWVLPTHIGENWSLSKFAAVFDAVDAMPPLADRSNIEDMNLGQRSKWRGANRQKRILLATLHGDSTVVYYIMHDGIVKPRQN